MAQKINNIAIPSSMASRGTYDFQPPRILGFNGERKPIRIKGATVTWTFDELDSTEWTWWVTTLLTSLDYKEFTQATFINNNAAEAEYTHCIVYLPVREFFEPGPVHRNVTITITDIY